MAGLEEVQELINTLCSDTSIPKNVRAILDGIKKSLSDDGKPLGVKINESLQALETVSLDPNLSSYARSQILSLASLLEGLL